MTMILIRSGTFLMSSLEPDNVPFYGGTLPPRVRITKPFWLGMHLVTVGQYRKFVEESKHDVDKTWWQNVGFQQTDDCPVVNVMWDDAKAFCEWLSRKEGRHYRLPTEAEWEYACRAGTRTLFSFGDDVSDLGDHAWFDMNSLGKTHAVGQKRPNAWGLFDMHGNASQWCQDWYDHRYYAKSPTDDPTGPAKGSLRVYRGGSWKYPAEFCRSLVRESDGAGVRRIYLGFRVCLVPADK
jgi:formylglycine-generating enzyme required for sulfatase activity